MSNTLVKTAKNQLRSHIKAELAKLSPAVVNSQSQNVFYTLQELEPFQSANKIAIYMSMATEIQTLPIIKYCFLQDKQVFLPQCIYEPSHTRRKNHLKMRRLKSFQEVLDLIPRGKYGLLEPIDGEDLMDVGGLDLIIVPGVAFNHEKKRLGHGIGYYDEFLADYTSKYRRPYILGLGLREQLVEQIPVEHHDFTLDGVIIDGELINI